MEAHEERHLLSAYLDGELTVAQRGLLEAHLPSCGSCRSELEEARAAKTILSAAPRRALPPDLAAALERGLARRSRPWSGLFAGWLARPLVLVPAGAFAALALLAVSWLGLREPAADHAIALEPLVAAHSRYAAEALVPRGDLVASNYSAQMNDFYGDGTEQE